MAEESPTDMLARPDQTLREHLRTVARQAEGFAARFNAGAWGKTAGLLHDIGKASAKFQNRVRGDGSIRVDHSTAGAREAALLDAASGRLMAYCIAGHHSGLPDGVAHEDSSLEHRLDPARRRIEDCPAWRECLGADANLERPGGLPFDCRAKGFGFPLALFTRMLFSCLVDADRLDAEAMGDPERALARSAYPTLETLAARLDAHLAKFTTDTEVRRIRAEVLAACRQGAAQTPGLFSLTVPTGGGKTLSSLAFALDHALRHGLSRVVYVIPFTSIIEQNARVFREALGDPDGDFVVEHHSNLLPRERLGKADAEDEDSCPHPATENWDAPVIVTTAVQFFESLFSHKAGRCRKLHNLARSVIILDEAQMLPLPQLKPCLEALRELTRTYGASVVLCTATQPALHAPDPAAPSAQGLKSGLNGVREIMSDPPALHAALKRVDIRHMGQVTDADLGARLAVEPQALCIVSTRRAARTLFEALRGQAQSKGGLFHLSALMCPQHRTAVLERIKTALREGRPCRVVSTTLVEAGVDVDFPVVFRAEAGLDSIAQAAGRCNREGKLDLGRVYVFRPEGGLPAGIFRRAAEAARSVVEKHQADLLHPDAVRDYFLELYWRTGDDQLDAGNILKRLTENAGSGWFPFREIGQEFRLIDDATQGLIIPYDDAGFELVRRLDALPADGRAGALLRRLQRHTVSLYTRDFDRLEKAGAIRRAGPGGQFFVLDNESLYDPLVGLDLLREHPGVRAPEDLYA